MYTLRLAAELLYETDPVRPAVEEEEDSSEIWRNLERCLEKWECGVRRSGVLKTLL
jgi:hypothetical protein